jgi:hypothetical protein
MKRHLFSFLGDTKQREAFRLRGNFVRGKEDWNGWFPQDAIDWAHELKKQSRPFDAD